MKHYLILILFLIIQESLFGQDYFLRVEKVSDGNDFNFPIILTVNKRVQEKINIHLQLAELEIIKGKEKKNVFENVTINNGTIYGGKVSIEYEILENTNQNFAVKFTESSCGMTCAYWVRYYNFNPQNGDKYFVQDFFAQEKLDSLKKIVTPKRQESIRNQIIALSALGESLEDLEEYIYTSIEEDNLDDFYFIQDSIYFDNENLLNRHHKYWDLNHKTGFSILEVKHLLNDFGKSALVTGEKLIDYKSVTEPQLYEGKIDNTLSFYLLFKLVYQNDYSGIYAYKKYGKGINLEGKLKNNEFIFSEKNDRFNEVAKVNFQKEQFNLKGYWTDNKNRKRTFAAMRK